MGEKGYFALSRTLVCWHHQGKTAKTILLKLLL